MGNLDLELTDEMVKRNDDIYNAVYEACRVITNLDADDFLWDMEILGNVTEFIKEEIIAHGYLVYHSGIVIEKDGKQYYSNVELCFDNSTQLD